MGIRETAAKPKMVLLPSEQHCLGGGVRALTAFQFYQITSTAAIQQPQQQQQQLCSN